MEKQQESEEYIEASSKARLIVVLIIIAGVIAIGLIKTKIDNIALSDVESSVLIFSDLLDQLLIFSLILSFVLSAYFIHLAKQVKKTGRYPPPDFSVIRRTRIITGHKVKKLIWLAYAVAILAWFPVLTFLYIKWLFLSIT